MSIAENVRKAALEKSAENLPKGTNTADLQTQAATGATGKGQSTGQSLKQSNIAEQMGMAEARGAQQDVAVKGLEAAQQVATKEAEVEVQQKEIDASNRNQEMQHDMEQADKMDQVMSDIEYSDAKMEDRKDSLVLEKVAAQLRLSDEKYRHEIEQTGTRNRIDSSAEIAKEAARLEIGSATSLLYDKIDHANKNAAEDREDREKGIMMSLNDAFKITEAKIQDEVSAAKISFVKDAADTGVSAYAASGPSQNPDAPEAGPIQQGPAGGPTAENAGNDWDSTGGWEPDQNASNDNYYGTTSTSGGGASDDISVFNSGLGDK
jgi:hypothetical protein